jgi:hypothetical protein
MLIAEKLDKLDVLEDDLKYILEKNPNNVSALNALNHFFSADTQFACAAL